MSIKGFCECGCGQPTPIAKVSRTDRDQVRGEPVRFIHGHNNRGLRVDNTRRYVEDKATGCWNWSGPIDRPGYGVATGGLAHRLMYEQFVGPIPLGLDLDHLCRNRRCVNPAHLEPVTRLENVRRGVVPKLTPPQVSQIKASTESYAALARRFGVSKGAIQAIKSGRSWRDVEAAA